MPSCRRKVDLKKLLISTRSIRVVGVINVIKNCILSNKDLPSSLVRSTSESFATPSPFCRNKRVLSCRGKAGQITGITTSIQRCGCFELSQTRSATEMFATRYMRQYWEKSTYNSVPFSIPFVARKTTIAEEMSVKLPEIYPLKSAWVLRGESSTMWNYTCYSERRTAMPGKVDVRPIAFRNIICPI